VRCIPCEVAFQTRCHLTYPCALPEADISAKMWAGKTVIVSQCFTKITYVQVTNLIPIKVPHCIIIFHGIFSRSYTKLLTV
jgi:hypothetical protein